MNTEVTSVAPPQEAQNFKQPEVNRWERHRLIAHLGRTFSRRYDLQVLPSRQRGVWACGLDPKITPEIEKYVKGQRDTLDDLSAESFTPKQILYDEQAAQGMTMEQITTLLHHEAGHAKYTDFRFMVEGQKQAKDEGHLPTSFWLTFEGIEDPRVNALEGEESPAIDRQIRANQAKDLQDRLTESPVSQRPQMLQFAYNSFHYWLHGTPIPDLQGTDVGRVTELARPLLEQYFQNSDPEERKVLQKQIWDIAKELEKKDIEQEEMRQMAQQRGQQQKGQSGNGEGQQQQGQSSDGSGGQPGGSGQGQESQGQSGSSSGQEGQSGGVPNIPGGQGNNSGESNGQANQQGRESGSQGGNNEGQGKGHKRFLDRLKDSIFGSKNKPNSHQQPSSQDSSGQQSQAEKEQGQGSGEEYEHSISKPVEKPKPEKLDLSKLSPEELQELKEAIEKLSPEQKAELAKKAREAIDEEQKESLRDKLSKLFKLEKNKQTGEYEAVPQIAGEKAQKQSEADYQQAVQ